MASAEEKPISKPLNPHALPFYIPLVATGHQTLANDSSTVFHPQPAAAVGGFSFCHHPHMLHSYSPNYQPQPVYTIPCNNTYQFGNELTQQNTNTTHLPEVREDRKNDCSRDRIRTAAKRAQPSQKKWVLSEWRVKTAAGNRHLDDKSTTTGDSSGARPILPFPATMEEAKRSRTTTVMIKNIPYNYQFEDLLLLLDDHCMGQNTSEGPFVVRSKYNFIYLPMDYKHYAYRKRASNLGYAFVNFTTAIAAFKFFQYFNGHKFEENNKTCEITRALYQGKLELRKRFEDKVFKCVCPSFRPVEFSPARDGMNRRIKGSFVGKYVKGLPENSLRS